MSDDLVKQLQNPRPMSMFLTRADQVKDWTELLHTAAARIEELSNCVAVLEAKLAQQDDLIKERSDEVQAAVAAALREAEKVVNAWVRRAMHLSSDGYEIERTHGYMAQEASDAILALITPDAQAALDRALLAEVRAVKESLTAAYIELAEERERCAQVAYDAWMDGVPIAEIPAAIRKGRE